MTNSMKINQERNHPRKGDRITVEPIRRDEDIETIKKMLSDSPRDLLLFIMGINNGLRIGDLLQLKVSQVRYLKEGGVVMLREQKTGKQNVLMINKSVYRTMINYFTKCKLDDGDYLFKSRKNNNKPLSVSSANALIKKWTSAVNLKGNYGTHSLRKTFGYIQRKKYGVGFEILCKRFNHSSPAVTMRYLGIEDKEINRILLNEI